MRKHKVMMDKVIIPILICSLVGWVNGTVFGDVISSPSSQPKVETYTIPVAQAGQSTAGEQLVAYFTILVKALTTQLAAPPAALPLAVSTGPLPQAPVSTAPVGQVDPVVCISDGSGNGNDLNGTEVMDLIVGGGPEEPVP